MSAAPQDEGYALLVLMAAFIVVFLTGVAMGAVFTRWWIERKRDQDMNIYYRSFRDDRHDGNS